MKYMSFRQGGHLMTLILLGNDLGCPITMFETNYPEYESEVTLVLLLCFFFLLRRNHNGAVVKVKDKIRLDIYPENLIL